MCARKIIIADDSAEFCAFTRSCLFHHGTNLGSGISKHVSAKSSIWSYSTCSSTLDGEELRSLREILPYDDLQPVIMVSAYGDTEAVLDFADGGEFMFLHKQEFSPELLARMVGWYSSNPRSSIILLR